MDAMGNLPQHEQEKPSNPPNSAVRITASRPNQRKKRPVAKKLQGLTAEEMERKRLRNNEQERARQHAMAYYFRVLAEKIPPEFRTSLHKADSKIGSLENGKSYIGFLSDLIQEDENRKRRRAESNNDGLLQNNNICSTDPATAGVGASIHQSQGHPEVIQSMPLNDITHHVIPPSDRVSGSELVASRTKQRCMQKENHHQTIYLNSPSTLARNTSQLKMKHPSPTEALMSQPLVLTTSQHFHQSPQHCGIPNAKRRMPNQVIPTLPSLMNQTNWPGPISQFTTPYHSRINVPHAQQGNYASENPISFGQSSICPVWDPQPQSHISDSNINNTPNFYGSGLPYQRSQHLQVGDKHIAHSTPKLDFSTPLITSAPTETPVLKESEINDFGLLNTFEDLFQSFENIHSNTSNDLDGNFTLPGDLSCPSHEQTSGYGTGTANSLEEETSVPLIFPEHLVSPCPTKKEDKQTKRKINFDEKPASPRLHTPPLSFTEQFKW